MIDLSGQHNIRIVWCDRHISNTIAVCIFHSIWNTITIAIVATPGRLAIDTIEEIITGRGSSQICDCNFIELTIRTGTIINNRIIFYIYEVK